jgi:hypothetical protein
MLKERTSLVTIQKICVEIFIQIDQGSMLKKAQYLLWMFVPIFGNQMFGDPCCALSLTFFNFGVTKVPVWVGGWLGVGSPGPLGGGYSCP